MIKSGNFMFTRDTLFFLMKTIFSIRPLSLLDRNFKPRLLADPIVTIWFSGRIYADIGYSTIIELWVFLYGPFKNCYAAINTRFM